MRRSGQEIWARHCGLIISHTSQFKRAVDSTVRQRFLTDSASLFLTPLLLVSSAEHLKAKASVVGNNCVKRRLGFQKASNKRGIPQLVLPSRALTRQDEEKSINMSSTPEICSTILSLDYAKSSRPRV
jgi:hypothetical protein